MTTRDYSSYWIAIFFLVAGACSSGALHPQTAEKIAGVYSDWVKVGFGSTSIELRSDGTFSYSSFSCISDKETTGEWKLIAPNLVLANSFVHQEPSPIEGREDRSSKAISITVVDIEGIRLPGARISMECQNGDVLSAVSDQAGEATLKACRIKTIFAEAVGFQDAEATSLDPQHNDFTMTLRTYPWFHIQDRLWYIRKGQLFELSRPLLTKKVMTREGGK